MKEGRYHKMDNEFTDKQKEIIEKLLPKAEGLLRSYKSIKTEIKNLQYTMEEFQNDSIEYISPDFSKDRLSRTNKRVSEVEQNILNKEKQVEYFTRLIKYKENQLKRVENAMETLLEKEREFVKFRYFEQMTIVMVAEEMCMHEITMYDYRKK